MNLKLEVFLTLTPDDYSEEGIAALSLAFSDLIVERGLGNIATEDGRLDAILVVRPFEEEISSSWWTKLAKNAMVINFPTEDPDFIKLADEGGVEGL